MPITIDPDDNQFDMGLLRLEDQELVSDEFEYAISGESDVRGSTDSNDPIGYKGSRNEFSWSASDIAPEFKSLLQEYILSRKTFPITVFHHGVGGDYVHEGTLIYARVTEVTSNYGEEGASLDVSGTALGFELP